MTRRARLMGMNTQDLELGVINHAIISEQFMAELRDRAALDERELSKRVCIAVNENLASLDDPSLSERPAYEWLREIVGMVTSPKWREQFDDDTARFNAAWRLVLVAALSCMESERHGYDEIE